MHASEVALKPRSLEMLSLTTVFSASKSEVNKPVNSPTYVPRNNKFIVKVKTNACSCTGCIKIIKDISRGDIHPVPYIGRRIPPAIKKIENN